MDVGEYPSTEVACSLVGRFTHSTKKKKNLIWHARNDTDCIKFIGSFIAISSEGYSGTEKVVEDFTIKKISYIEKM